MVTSAKVRRLRVAWKNTIVRWSFIGIVSVAGVVLLLTVHAASGVSSIEAENGTVQTATVVSDTNASNLQAIKFAAIPTGGGGNTCTNPQYTLPWNPSNPQDGYTLSGYYVTNDTWNFSSYPGSNQIMYICNYNNWYASVTVKDTGDGAVKTYPNVHKDYNSPKVSTFNSIVSTYAHTAPSTGAWDYAYDVWMNGLNYELMVWTQSAGRQAHVPGIAKVATVTLSGITYDIHRTGSYIAYDMPTTRTSGTINLLEIIRDAQSRGYVPSTATLTQIDYGVEVCDTGNVPTKFEVNGFSVTSN